ncbi:hypothetical protein [Hydrogenobacter thermophilus]|uniref:hypothetical protein n=1 Tax=Hydrogenobacter thermophilus TaxID=940 RepID=UPI0030F5EDBB
MIAFFLYILFEFTDTIFSSFLMYIHFPSKSHTFFSASSYGYLITLSNLLGFTLLLLGLYRFGFLSYSFYLATLSVLSLLIGFSHSMASFVLIFLFFIFHTAFFFWYEVLAVKFEKFEALIGLSYSAGFFALGILLFFEKLSLPLLSVLYSVSLFSMLLLRKIELPQKRLRVFQLKTSKFITEVLTVWLMGEYAEVLASMAYYVLKDTAPLSDAQIHKLFAVALLSAFLSALISPFLLERLNIKRFGRLTLLLMISIPFLLGFPSLFYLLSTLVGSSIAFYWVFFRTYLYYTYPKEEYIGRFMFFYFSSHIGGVFLYSLLFQLFQSHQLSLLIFSTLLFPVLIVNIFS